jgi:hypothetical protein
MTNRTFCSHGVAIGVRSNDPVLLDRAASCFTPGWESTSASKMDAWYSLVRSPGATAQRPHYELFQEERKLDEGFRLSRLLETMDSAIRVEVGRRTPQRLFVHAGVVGWRNRAIVIPGLSGAGKTTLVAALVRAGATYGSDEYAVLDEQGLVHPYARPMSFRQGPHRRVRRDAVTELGGQAASGPLPVGLVVHTRHCLGAEWRPHQIPAGQSALSIFANVLVARDRPAFAFSILSHAMHHAISLRGDRGEADAAAAAILTSADQIPSPSVEGTPS